MRLIDADELMEHVWRDKLDSRELIAEMIEKAPTVKEIPTKIPIDVFEKLISPELKAEHSELFINKPCISTGVCHEDKIKMLDKVRVEIEKAIDGIPITFSRENADSCLKKDIAEIIDKYKGESEDKA